MESFIGSGLGWGLGSLFMAVLSFLIYRGMQQAKATLTWPTTRGTVTCSEVVWTGFENSTDETITSKKSTYRHNLSYQFSVGGMSYGSTALGYRIHGGSESALKLLVEQYPAGAEVTVYYDPANPKKAVLEPGGNATQKWLCFGTIVLAMVFVFLALVTGK
jgi:hypothetical protein